MWDVSRHPWLPLEALTGQFRGVYKLRVGDYRALFRIDQSARHFRIVAVGHRSDVYDDSWAGRACARMALYFAHESKPKESNDTWEI